MNILNKIQLGEQKKNSILLISVFIFLIIATAWSGLLFLYSLKYTAINQVCYTEFLTLSPSSWIRNIGLFLLGLFVFILLGFIYDKWLCHLPDNCLLFLVCLLIGLLSICWVLMVRTHPEADQLQIAVYSDLWASGEIAAFQQSDYMVLYDQNLGLMTVMVFLIRLFGSDAVLAFQLLVALLLPAGVFWGYHIVGMLAGKKSQFFYLLLMLTCFPLYIYVPFLYGDVISVILALGSTLYLLRFLQDHRLHCAVLFVLFTAVAILLRKNILIFFCAYVIVLLWAGLRKSFFRCTLLAILPLLLALLLDYGNHRLYHIPADAKPSPAITYICMGMNDQECGPGWFNGESQVLYIKNNYDTAAARREAKEIISQRLNNFIANPGYAKSFYMRKITMQWEAPMYQCLPMNRTYKEDANPFVVSIYGGTAGAFLEGYMKSYQVLLYGGIFILLIMHLVLRKKDPRSLEWYTLLIAAFGGFLFSLIWEAKPRYVFPYFLIMIPYLAVFLETLYANTTTWVKRLPMLRKAVTSAQPPEN